MSRLRTSFALNVCAVSMALVASASAAVTARRIPMARETVLEQGQGGAFAANRPQATHFLSPGASAPVAPRVMTPQDRQILRQQIQSTASGHLPQPQPASTAPSN